MKSDMQEKEKDENRKQSDKKMCSFGSITPKKMYTLSEGGTYRDSLSTVTKQVKKYKNRLEIRDSERFADFGSLLGSLFSCFDNSVIVCLLID